MANRIVDIARDDSGSGVASATAVLKRESDGVAVPSAPTQLTAADGGFGWTEEEVPYPGPVRYDVTEPGGTITRIHSGRSIGQIGTWFASDFVRAMRVMTDGVLVGVEGELAVSADGTSMDVDVAPGFAFVYGHPSWWPVAQTLTIGANGDPNPRIDLVVLRLDPPGTATEGKQVLAVLPGTPAASPVAPTVTQDATTWEVALAEVRVESGAASIAAGKVTDARTWTTGPLVDGSITGPKLADGAVTTAKVADAAVTTAKVADEAVTPAKLQVPTGVSTAGQTKVLRVPDFAAGTVVPEYAPLDLADLADVADSAPGDLYFLVWDNTAGLWTPWLGSPVLPGLRVNGNPVLGADDTSQTLIHGHLTFDGAPPTVTLGAAAGTGATVTWAGTDGSFRITLVTGTGAGVGTLVSVTFAYPWPTTEYEVLFSARDADASLSMAKVYVDGAAQTVNGFDFKAHTALADSTSFLWTFHVLGGT